MRSWLLADSLDAPTMSLDPHAGQLRRPARWLVLLVLVALLALTFLVAFAPPAALTNEPPLLAPRSCGGTTCPAGIES